MLDELAVLQEASSSPEPAVLGVTLSAGRRRWVWRHPELMDTDNRSVHQLAQQTGLSELVARVLTGRGVRPDQAHAFLEPRLRDSLPDPSCLTDMDKAAERLALCVRNREHIGILGDYDVDGACGTALLCSVLRELGCTVSTHIPDRMTEGYGPNAPALERFLLNGATLLLCVDCGTSAIEILDGFEGRAERIVLDHHKPDGAILPKGILVNPNRLDCASGLGHLCATSIAFLTMIATVRALRREGWFETAPAPDLMKHLDLTALATICDVMPLRDLNRTLVTQGLRVMARNERPGLAALAAVAGVRHDGGAMACGFALGPRINAGGRIAQAELGLKLLLSQEAEEARLMAEKLDTINRQRQTVESSILNAAIEQAERQIAEGHAVLFLHGADWHPGVVGIVAGRLKERFNRPALVGALSDGAIKGSARSVPGLDIGAAVIRARQSNILRLGGGHIMAAGFTLAVEQAAAFHEFLDGQLASARDLPPQDDLRLDGVIALPGASEELVAQLSRLAPFGPANEEPLLAISHVRCVRADRIGREKNTLRVILQGEDGHTRLKGLVFRAGEKEFSALLEDRSMPLLHVAGHLRLETWQERQSLTFFISDAAAS